MDPVVEPSFRKPSNDTANRKYRRHSPLGRASSSSSGGSPQRERSLSPVTVTDSCNKMTGDGSRKDSMKDLERDTRRYQPSRVDSSRRHPDRSPRGNSHDYRRHSARYEKHADEEDQRSSRTGREYRGGSRYDHGRHDGHPERSRDYRRDVDKYSRDKPSISEHYRPKERDSIVSEHYRPKERDSERVKLRDSERTASGSRQVNSVRDDDRTRERPKARDDRRERKNHPHDLVRGKESDSYQSEEPHRKTNKEIDGIDNSLKRKHDGKESERSSEKYASEPKDETTNRSSRASIYREKDRKNERFTGNPVDEDRMASPKKPKDGMEAEGKPSSSLKQVSETPEIAAAKPVNSIKQADTTNGLDAAKVAAQRAADLVNRNLVGGAYLSTDQKKKLLWGNKKNTTVEESQPTNRWDLQLFADRERQEKFNKLMGVKTEVVPEQKVDDKDAEKQRELLNMDLEKQYTAGLRRRDGRTVGLGL